MQKLHSTALSVAAVEWFIKIPAEPIRHKRQYFETYQERTWTPPLDFVSSASWVHDTLSSILQRGAWLLMAPLDGGG